MSIIISEKVQYTIQLTPGSNDYRLLTLAYTFFQNAMDTNKIPKLTICTRAINKTVEN